ncbi:hypothetical protein Ddye_002491 [Dipteronia dyeriana]|uniref:Nodulin-like domain-containing protein n=1 Tax=Dipteronia dyeriana TaxID=168575 RepID=A0AAD9XRN5_9ROSI|nr:hypothetical protein Ddye_002491 [Dipteronia dyeriana]
MMERLNSKWIATVASIWIQCSIGGTYTFGIYSSTLKSTQNYDQSTLERVAIFKDIGSCSGLLSGLLYSFVTLDRHRHRCFCRRWRSIPADNVTGVRNFPAHVGTIVGLLEGYLGLSGAMLIQVYDVLFEGNPINYLLFLAVFPTSVSLLLMYFVRIHANNSEDDKKHLNALSAAALIMVAYLMILIILENIFTLGSSERIVTFIFLMLLLASPLGIAFRAQREDAERLVFSQTFSTDERNSLVYNTEPIASMAYHDQLPGDDSCQSVQATLDENIIQIEENMNLQQVICTGNFWLLFIAMICGLGSGIATINNISQVGESLGYTSIEINSLVSLLSIWNFLGRLGAGYVSDIFLQRHGYPRPLFIAITQAALSVGLIVIASGFPYNLYVGTILVGVCYGSQWSLLASVASEIFGVGHLGTIVNTFAIASPIGSYIFSVRIIGYIYDKAASGEDNSCYGTRCFMLSFLIIAFFALCGCLVALLLFFRTRRSYDKGYLGLSGAILIQVKGKSQLLSSVSRCVSNFCVSLANVFAQREEEVKRLLSQTFSSDMNLLVTYNPEPVASMAYHELPGYDACQCVGHLGTITMTIGITSPIGSYIFSVRIIGYLYDKAAAASGEENSCSDTHCFMLSFLIIARTLCSLWFSCCLVVVLSYKEVL